MAVYASRLAGRSGCEGDAMARTKPDEAPTEGLTARRMARTRASLARAAARLFTEQGYEATTVEGICARVEVSPRTFFRYFASKDDVLDELVESHLDAFAAALGERPAGEALLDSLLNAATCGYPSAPEGPDFLELFAVVHRTPALRARWLDRAHEDQSRLAAILAERLPPAGDPLQARLAAGALVGTMTTVVEVWAENPDAAPLRDLAVRALRLLAAGLGFAEPGAPG